MGVTDRGEILEFVRASLGSRNDVMDVERPVTLAAEKARDGTTRSVAF